MKPKTSRILMFSIFGGVLAITVFWLIFGILTHEEPGLADPERGWDHVPLTVSCKGYVAAEDGACSAAEEIVGRVNSRLGFEMLSWKQPGPTDIQITMRAPVETGTDEPGGDFHLLHAGDVYLRCDVRTMNVSGGAGDLEQLVLYHELGHCLGLDHDDDDRSGPLTHNSIMRPVQRETPDRTIPHWLSDNDKSILVAKYGAEGQ